LKNNPKRGYNSAKLSRKKKELSKESEKTQGNRGGFGKESAFIGVSHRKEASDLVRR
jgi:hypothetical protein